MKVPKIIFSLLIVMGFLGFAAIVYAGNFSISPANPSTDTGWFVYEIRPGDSLNDEVVVKNLSDKESKLEIYSVDREESDSSGEGFSPKSKDAERLYVGKWITLGKNLITLAPNAEEKIRFTIKIPSDTAQKDYAGAIIVQEEIADKSDIKSTKDQQLITVATRGGVRMYVKVTDNPRIIKKAENSEAGSAVDINKELNIWTPINVILGVVFLALIIYLIYNGFIKKEKKSE